MRKEKKYLDLDIRGQVTIFVIAAIILVAVGGVFIFTSQRGSSFDQKFSSNADIQNQFDQLKNSITDCIDISAIDSLNNIGIQGGYYTRPEKYFDFEDLFIPYYYYEGNSLVPDNFRVESELEKSSEANIKSCLKSLNNTGFILDYSDPKADVKINPKNVDFVFDLNIGVSRDKNVVTFDLKDVPKSYELPLNDILYMGKYITDASVKDDSMFCLTCIAKEAENRSLYVDIINVENSSTLFIVYENYTSSGPYALEFLNKYKGEIL